MKAVTHPFEIDFPQNIRYGGRQLNGGFRMKECALAADGAGEILASGNFFETDGTN